MTVDIDTKDQSIEDTEGLTEFVFDKVEEVLGSEEGIDTDEDTVKVTIAEVKE